MSNVMQAATATDEERTAAALEKLPPEQVRKVRIFAETLVQIFERRRLS